MSVNEEDSSEILKEESHFHELPSLVREWRSTEDELKILSSSMKEKRKRIKIVREMITRIMKAGNIGKLEIKSGTVCIQPLRPKKDPISKKYLENKLLEFFEGDKERAIECVKFLESNRPIKTGEQLVLRPPENGGGGSSVVGGGGGGSVAGGGGSVVGGGGSVVGGKGGGGGGGSVVGSGEEK